MGKTLRNLSFKDKMSPQGQMGQMRSPEYTVKQRSSYDGLAT